MNFIIYTELSRNMISTRFEIFQILENLFKGLITLQKLFGN